MRALWWWARRIGAVLAVLAVLMMRRPEDVDPAILRRMPRTCHIALPDASQRQAILSVLLAGHALAPGVAVTALAADTPGYSGSDLAELCRNAALQALREVASDAAFPPLTATHFARARTLVEHALSSQTA